MSGGARSAGQETTVGTTVGTLLGGRVPYEQSAAGYRTGIEPVFLAAAVPCRAGERVLELGTGAGAALLCLATRVPGVLALGVERDEATAVLARRNVAPLPGLSVLAGSMDQLGSLPPFDHACANPPWHDPAGTPPPDATRRLALQARADTLDTWCNTLVRHLRPGGTVTLVLPARLAGEGEMRLRAAGAGRVLLRPLLPRENRPPRIVLLQGVVGTDAPGAVLPGLVLHRPEGGYTDAAEAVLRGAEALGWSA